MMSALCTVWAHTCHAMCLGYNPEQLRLEAFRLPKPPKINYVTYLPDYHQTDGC